MISDGASAARDAASSTSSDTLVVSIRQLRKAFRGKPVVHCDTLDIRRGELCGLFGPNGSGKTALIKTLAGVYIPDDGEVLLDGVVYEPLCPADALARGVAYVPQFGFLPESLTKRQVERLLGRHLTNSTHLPAGRLSNTSPIMRHALECELALSMARRLLLFDEPQFPYTVEYSQFGERIREYCSKHCAAAIIVLHDLEKLRTLCDTIMLMSAGAETGSASITKIENCARAQSNQLLPGSEQASKYKAPEPLTHDINFASTFHPGEISVFYGVSSPDCERIRNEFLDRLAAQYRNQIALLPGHWTDRGLALNCTLKDNLLLASLSAGRHGVFHRVSRDHEKDVVNALHEFGITPPDLNERAANLSGGNKQRLALARAVLLRRDALVIIHPLRGLDTAGIELMRLKIAVHVEAGGIAIVLAETFDEAATFTSYRADKFIREADSG